MGRVTQQQVAERAGVTRATVSYVLGGRAEELKISAPVAKRVREAAEHLGYVPNYAARALSSGKALTLGLRVGASSPFWSRMAEGAEKAALEQGYDVMLLSRARDPEAGGLTYLHQGRIDALIALHPVSGELAEAWRRASPAPVVVQAFGPAELPSVGLNAAPGLADAVEHLVGLGHSRLAWLAPASGGNRSRYGRASAVLQAAAERGVEATVVDVPVGEREPRGPADRQIAFWRRALEDALPGPLPVTALLCWNDRMALGLYDLLGGRGMRVPRDVSVVGFDDYEAGAALPAMSSVSHEFRQMGAEATRLALRIVNGELGDEEARETVVEVPSRFIARESTGPAPR